MEQSGLEPLASALRIRLPAKRYAKTPLINQGWEFSDITQCLYANMQRSARTLLEERGVLSPRQKHKNGAQWIFWAQEPETNGDKK